MENGGTTEDVQATRRTNRRAPRNYDPTSDEIILDE
jgi:hypothetical protein